MATRATAASKLDALLTAIAARRLGFETLETRRVGDYDFREVAVWTVKDALTDAYNAGVAAGQFTAKPKPKPNPRRNGSYPVMWAVRQGRTDIGEIVAGPNFNVTLVRKAAKLAAEQGISANEFKRWGTLSDGMVIRRVSEFLRN